MKFQYNELFIIIKRCIQFYEKIFGIKYPFFKIDSIFCPEFIYSAMENPGCITYSTKLLYKNKPTT